MSFLKNSADFLAFLLTVLWFNSSTPLSFLSLAGTYRGLYAVKLVLICNKACRFYTFKYITNVYVVIKLHRMKTQRSSQTCMWIYTAGVHKIWQSSSRLTMPH